MIIVNCHIMFRGKMKIAPKRLGVEPIIIESSWLYKPDLDCWYNKEGKSFPHDMCEILEDYTK